MSSLLSRLLILLCIIGWIQHIDHANSNRGGNLAAKDARAFAVSPPKQATATPIQPDLQPIASAAAQSPHAIMPDATLPQASANSPAPPPQTENTKSLSQPIKSLHPSPGLVSI